MPQQRRVELLRGAEADLLEHFVHLEERRAGSGERFYRSIDMALELLRQQPHMAPLCDAKYRRLVLRAYKIGIFYALEGERVMVGAILDLRQNPEAIARRLRR